MGERSIGHTVSTKTSNLSFSNVPRDTWLIHAAPFPFCFRYHLCTSIPRDSPFSLSSAHSWSDTDTSQGLTGLHVPTVEDACALLLLIKLYEHSVWFEPSNQTDPANRNRITPVTIRVNHCSPFFSRPMARFVLCPFVSAYAYAFVPFFMCQTMLKRWPTSLW